MYINICSAILYRRKLIFFFFSWAAVASTVHYGKRLLETLFVHRFSHATMPLRNLFKNCSYYWLFTMYVAYHVNHPLYTAPSTLQFYIGAAIFTLCEIGNLSIHLALKNLRPPGTTVRKIPMPTGVLPFTALFNFVSCPNYTYEIGSWIGFTIMTSCLPGMSVTEILCEHIWLLTLNANEAVAWWIICFNFQLVYSRSPVHIKWLYGHWASIRRTRKNSRIIRKTVKPSFHSFSKLKLFTK